MASQDFTIETKLKIAGVVATGKLDAGTLKFNVDTSALAKLATDAKKTADKIAKHFEGIKLDKFTVDINTASLNAITKQLKTAIELAAKQAKISVTPSVAKTRGASTKQSDDVLSAPTKAAGELARTISDVSSSISRLNSKLNDLASTITGITSKATSASAEKQRTARATAPKTFPLDPNAPAPFSGRKIGVPDRGYQDFIKKQQSLQATVNKEQLQAAKEKTKSTEKESKSATNLGPKMAKLGEAIDQAKTVISSFKTQLNPLASESGAFSKIGANAKLVNDGMNSIKASITNLVRSFGTLTGANEKQKKAKKPTGGDGSTLDTTKPSEDPKKASKSAASPLSQLSTLAKDLAKSFTTLVGKSGLPLMAETVKSVNQGLGVFSSGLAKVTGATQNATDAQQAATKKTPLENFNSLLKQANGGLKGLIKTLAKVANINLGKGGARGGAGPQTLDEINASLGGILPAGAKMGSVNEIMEEAKKPKPKTSFLFGENDFSELVDYEKRQRIAAAEAAEAAYSKVEKARLRRLKQLQKEVDTLGAKERDLIAQLSGAKIDGIKTGMFGGGYVPGQMTSNVGSRYASGARGERSEQIRAREAEKRAVEARNQKINQQAVASKFNLANASKSSDLQAIQAAVKSLVSGKAAIPSSSLYDMSKMYDMNVPAADKIRQRAKLDTALALSRPEPKPEPKPLPAYSPIKAGGMPPIDMRGLTVSSPIKVDQQAIQGAVASLLRKEIIPQVTTPMPPARPAIQAGGSGGGGGGGGGRGGGGRIGGAAMPAGPGGGGGGQSATNIQALAKAMEEVVNQTEKANSKMDELETLSYTVGRKAAAFRGIAMALNTVVSSAQGAIKFIAEFSDSLVELNKILGLQQSSLSLVGDNFVALSKTTGVATSDIVEIATEFARAGLQGRGFGDVVDLTRLALLGMQGTSLTAAQSTEILIQVIQQVEGSARGLNKELVTSSKLFDILGRAEDITASKATDIQDAFKRSLSSLSATGSSMEELVAILSVVEERTQRGGDVIGTAFKTLASRIGNSASESAQALRSIGVETVDSSGKLRGIFDVLRDTSVAFQGLSEAEQANISVKVAGVRQVEIFRAALSNFGRLVEVNTELTNASGDADRKRTEELKKVGTTINRIMGGFQELAKAVADSAIGQMFVTGLTYAEEFVKYITSLNKSMNGFISTFAAGSAIALGIRFAIPIFQGMVKAFQFFVSGGEEAGKKMNIFNQSASNASTTVNTQLNGGLRNTAEVLVQLNRAMDEFNAKQERAAVAAKRVAAAEEMAVRELKGRGQKFSYQDVQVRTNEILGQQDRELQAARAAAFQPMLQTDVGKRQLGEAVRTAPEQFSEAERQAFGKLGLPLEKSTGIINKAMDKLRKSVDIVAAHPFMTGAALSVLGGVLNSVGKSTESAAARIAGSAAEFASMGMMFGPKGALIGGLIGGFYGLSQAMKDSQITIDALRDEYIRLGLIKTSEGQVTAEGAKAGDVAFQNLQTLRQYDTKKAQAGTAREEEKQRLMRTGGLTPEQAEKQMLQDRQKQQEAIRKNLTASYQAFAPEAVRQGQIMQALSESFKLNTGVSIDFTDQTLLAGASLADLSKISQDVYKSLLTIADPATAGKVIDAYEKAMNAAADRVANLSQSQQDATIEDRFESKSRQARLQANEARGGMAMGRAGQALINVAGISEQKTRSEFLQKLAAGNFSEEIQKTFDAIATGAQKDIPNTLRNAIQDIIPTPGVQARPGETPELASFREVATKAREIGLGRVEAQRIDQLRREGADVVGGAGAREFLSAVQPMLDKMQLDQQRAQARETERVGIATERQNLQSVIDVKYDENLFNDIQRTVKTLGQPVSKLEMVLRDFAKDFTQEIFKLKEARAAATTPEQEMASKNVELAREALAMAKSEAETGFTDAVRRMQRTVGEMEITGRERSIYRDEAGRLLPQYAEQPPQEDVTKGQVVDQFAATLLNVMNESLQKGITDKGQVRQMAVQRMGQLQPRFSEIINNEEKEQIIKQAEDTMSGVATSYTKVFNEIVRTNKSVVDQMKQDLDVQARRLDLDKRRYEVSTILRRAAIDELTGIRQVVAARQLESEQNKFDIAQSDEKIASYKKMIAMAQQEISQGQDTVAAKNKLFELNQKLEDEEVARSTKIAEEQAAINKAMFDGMQALLQAAQQEVDYQKMLISARGDLNDSLLVGERSIERFNRKLEQNAQSFKQTQAAFSARMMAVNMSNRPEAEKTAQLNEIRQQAAAAALEAAKAEAQIIAERRQSVQQITQDLVSNQQEQVSAQKSVIDATQAVSNAYMSYIEAVQGSILATTQYNLGVKMAQVETVKLTGGFSGIREQLGVVISTFREAESTARQLGANEKTLVDIRRQSIEQQLSLFNELLSQQSSMARQFFQSSAEDQAAMFLGIQEAGGIAEMLGGSFENFRKLGESSINQLGAQLLALPQETRQRIVSSLETLQGLGGTVGGFTASELLTAIETASLGVSGELQVDPLFEVQQRIADLTEQQARLATEQLITSQQAVDQSKQQLEEAQAAKDLAEIQLERIKEEGNQLRAKLGEVNGDLRTVILQQNATSATGFNSVTSIIARTNYILENTLPSMLSSSLGERVMREMQSSAAITPSAGGMTATNTAQSRGKMYADSIRDAGSNTSLQAQIANSAGPAPVVMGDAFGNAQQKQSNVPGGNSSQEANTRLNDILQVLQALSTTTTNNGQVLTEIRDRSGNAVGTAAANIGGTAEAPEITININGEQRVTVTGFEAGVSRIAQGLAETFGGFATEQEARNIAQEVVETIRTELQRLGLLQRNQF